MICEWCETNAGRTSNKDCCVLRRLAQMPMPHLKEYAKKLTKEERQELIPKLTEEYERLKGIK